MTLAANRFGDVFAAGYVNDDAELSENTTAVVAALKSGDELSLLQDCGRFALEDGVQVFEGESVANQISPLFADRSAQFVARDSESVSLRLQPWQTSAACELSP